MYKFDCGCEFENLDYYNLNRECPKTWDLYYKGLVKGIFQLESHLGKSMSEKIAPKNIEEASALIAALRPGVLKSYADNGKTIANSYIDRKHGREDVEYFHPLAEQILKSTEGHMLYQEQIIAIAKVFAGFDLVQADILRKSIGHKDAKKLAECRSIFVEGCVKVGYLDEGQAQSLFDNIEKSNRYLFNKCLHKNTIIGVYGKKPVTIEELYQIHHGKGATKQAEFNKTLLSMKQSRSLVPNELVRVYKNGIDKTYKVVLENGHSVIATELHELYTTLGKKSISYIKRQIDAGKEVFVFHAKVDFKNSLPKEEKVYTVPVKVYSVTYYGTCEVYDIEMSDPYHTYVLYNGIVVGNSHSIGYAETGYWSAYLKAHFPHIFYAAWLTFAKEKIDAKEYIRELVKESRNLGVEILPPKLAISKDVCTIEGTKVRYGLGNIKNFGTSQVELFFTVKANAEKLLNKPMKDFTWYETLVHILSYLRKDAVTNLLGIGAVDFPISRKLMMFEYNQLKKLSDAEILYLRSNNHTSLLEGVSNYVASASKVSKRKNSPTEVLKNLDVPPQLFVDDPNWIADIEKEVLGIALSVGGVDAGNNYISHKCYQFGEITTDIDVTLAVEIDRVSEWSPKDSDKIMAFLTLSDDTGTVESVVGSDLYKEIYNVAYQGNKVLVTGKKNIKKGNFSIRKMRQL